MEEQNKKPKGKKKWLIAAIAVVVVIVIAAIAGGGNEKQDDLLDYINKDIVELAEVEDRMLASYNSVSGVNYVDDLTMYTEINTNTIPLCQELNQKTLEIVPVDKEISDAHGIYRNYVTKMLNAFVMMNSAMENGDYDKVAEANDLLAEANDLAVQYQQEIRRLARERNVEFIND